MPGLQRVREEQANASSAWPEELELLPKRGESFWSANLRRNVHFGDVGLGQGVWDWRWEMVEGRRRRSTREKEQVDGWMIGQE